MERHEDLPDQDACCAGEDRPPEREPQAGADEADRDREVLKVAEEPQRRLVPELSVSLVLGHPVDGSRLDPLDAMWRRGWQALGLSRHLSVSFVRGWNCIFVDERCSGVNGRMLAQAGN